MKLRLGEPRIVGLRSRFWSTKSSRPAIKMSRRDGEPPPVSASVGFAGTNTRNLVGAADQVLRAKHRGSQKLFVVA
jgi:hypothetical protein